MVDKKMVKGQLASKSNFSDTVFSEQWFYFPSMSSSSLHIFTPNGESSTITGALCKRWIVSHDCPNYFVSTLEVHKYVPVGKSITDIPLKFELARSYPCANPIPTLARYTQCNTVFLFQNALLGKEATHLKEMHSDANNEEEESAEDEDDFAIVDVADMTESPGNKFVPIDNGSVGNTALKQTVGLVNDLVVYELPTDSPTHSEGSALNWLDKNKKRDGSFTLSFPRMMLIPNATPALSLYPLVFSHPLGYHQNRLLQFLTLAVSGL
jgi:hypothetical protein